MTSILPDGSDSKTSRPDPLSPAMRELADGIATFVETFMQEVVAYERSPLDVDYRLMAEDFVESCVVDIMQVGGGGR